MVLPSYVTSQVFLDLGNVPILSVSGKYVHHTDPFGVAECSLDFGGCVRSAVDLAPDEVLLNLRSPVDLYTDGSFLEFEIFYLPLDFDF